MKAALADRYAIERELGAGGMATVYLAHDVRHDRQVAVKVLKPELAAVIGGERFLHEIRVTAHLQHPHILALFDSGEADSFLFYVMPYVEGESLRDRLSREKQLPVEEAVEIAKAVASALDYAHRHKVIHRDIKPENILLHDGQPVVADFGIALAVSVAGGQRITETGISLGTPYYMSPEQATADRELDARSDIYSLGCVLYEMLGGEPPHTGNTVQAVIAKVLTDEPRRIRLVRNTVPPHVEAAIHKALAKLPADRFASANQFAEALTRPGVMASALEASALPPEAPAAIRAATAAVGVWLARNRTVALVSLLAAVASVTALWALARPRVASAPSRVVRLEVRLPPEDQFSTTPGTTIALSPGGTHLIVASAGLQDRRLLVRDLSRLETWPLTGSSTALRPFFSPDGNWVGFVNNAGRLQRVTLAGSPPVSIAPVGSIGDASWGDGDVIVFNSLSDAGLFQVAANGGTPVRLTQVDSARGETDHRQPHVLPGGKAALFVVWSRSVADAQLAVVARETGEIRRLGIAGTSPQFMFPGFLVYATQQQALFAVPFDLEHLAVTGAPVPVLERVVVKGGGSAEVALSPNGTLAYLSSSALSRLVYVDRRGAAICVRDELRDYASPRFSPDGQSLAVEIGGPTGIDIWVWCNGTATLSRLTFADDNIRPVWSPDGRRIAFSSTRHARRALYAIAADGSSDPELLVSTEFEIWEVVWTPDGRGMVFRQNHPSTGRDLWAVSLDSERQPRPLVVSQFIEDSPALSPDGRWLAYVSDESGRREVYVRPMEGGGRWQVSAESGTEPVWGPSGRELFYRSGESLVAARVRTTPTFSIEGRETVLRGRYRGLPVHANYDVHPSGQRFVMVAAGEEESSVVVAVNWVEEVKARLAAPR